MAYLTLLCAQKEVVFLSPLQITPFKFSIQAKADLEYLLLFDIFLHNGIFIEHKIRYRQAHPRPDIHRLHGSISGSIGKVDLSSSDAPAFASLAIPYQIYGIQRDRALRIVNMHELFPLTKKHKVPFFIIVSRIKPVKPATTLITARHCFVAAAPPVHKKLLEQQACAEIEALNSVSA